MPPTLSSRYTLAGLDAYHLAFLRRIASGDPSAEWETVIAAVPSRVWNPMN